jgi:hypothetical protein
MGICKTGGRAIFHSPLYFDDLLAVVDKHEAIRLKEIWEELYGSVQFEEGTKLSYHGIEMKITNHGTFVNVSFYMKQLLEGEMVEEQFSPGTKDT